MKTLCIAVIGGVSLLALAGCSPKEEPASTSSPAISSSNSNGGTTTPAQVVVSTGKPLGSLKVGGSAVCAVCSVKEGTKAEEEVKATLDYKGKTYGFCNESEKAEFISEPAKYAGN